MRQIKQLPAEASAIASSGAVAAPARGDRAGPLQLYKSPAGREAIMQWYQDCAATIGVAVASKYVETRYGRTHMLVAGAPDAPPLLLVPGIAGCAPLWRRQIPAFAEHFRVYALDIVGQPGKSDPLTPSFLRDDFSEWLLDVLDELNIRRAHFAGTSVGGWMVMRFGMHSPERVDKIVLLSPTGVARAKLPVKIWVTKYLNKRKDADALQDDLTAKSVTNRSPGASFGTFDRQLAKLMALCTRHYRVDRSMGIYDELTNKINFWAGMQVLRKFFLSEPRAVLRRFRSPALLVFGEHELLYNPWKVARRSKRLMPQLETDVIKGAGHAAIYDKPDEINARMIAYLLAETRNG